MEKGRRIPRREVQKYVPYEDKVQLFSEVRVPGIYDVWRGWGRMNAGSDRS